jgi:hypothetical protein
MRQKSKNVLSWERILCRFIPRSFSWGRDARSGWRVSCILLVNQRNSGRPPFPPCVPPAKRREISYGCQNDNHEHCHRLALDILLLKKPRELSHGALNVNGKTDYPLRALVRTSNSSTSSPNFFMAASIGCGEVISTPASFSKSKEYLDEPPERKPM